MSDLVEHATGGVPSGGDAAEEINQTGVSVNESIGQLTGMIDTLLASRDDAAVGD